MFLDTSVVIKIKEMLFYMVSVLKCLFKFSCWFPFPFSLPPFFLLSFFLLNALSFMQIITREAIYYGPADSSFKAALVDWALPYAQRYIYSIHPEKYLQFKLYGLNNLKQLKITVVEKLFYRNVIKSCGGASKKRYECSCLLQVWNKLSFILISFF